MTHSWRSGLYYSGSDIAGVQQMATWRGRPADVCLVFTPQDTWANIELSQSWQDTYKASVNPYADRMVVTLSMLPKDGSTLATGATGGYNAHFLAAAQHLVAIGLGNAIIRLGHEHNGTWYAWTSASNPTGFASMWRQVHDTMMGVPGAAFQWAWCIALGTSVQAASYPGDGYVDMVTIDMYDYQYGVPAGSTSPQARWANLMQAGNPTNDRGLTYWINFADAHGKPLAFGEWGVENTAASNGGGGGDDPYFVQQIAALFGTQNVDWEAAFNSDPTDGTHSLFYKAGSGKTTQFPNSAAMYLNLFGPTPTPPDQPPPPTPGHQLVGAGRVVQPYVG